ncbi:tetratricopeptide repeat protein [Geomonas sp. Red32]|uniref:tetratricopeptide repeat protein n=1 Tax=Geomonas sp. Red32 TaxID=2912856 RepID=UPI00202CB3CD|nr:tetratricopeptide repeat protein [Geomonas sp. Red32]MCM0081194.1 tetratricopeptide repeat protein [Geomonas sp. Red32]
MSLPEVNRGGAAVTEAEERPLVTAIVVARNQESQVRECVAGLMEQTIAQSMEVIVVDQGSDQSETAIVTDLQRRFGNIVSLRIPYRAGAYAGVNLAVKIASGRFITLLNVADRMRSEAYELLSATLGQHPEAMLAFGNTCLTAIPHQSFAQHVSAGSRSWQGKDPVALLRAGEVPNHAMWRRELHYTIGCIGEGDGAMGAFLQKCAERFSVVHLPEFTGLTMVAQGGEAATKAAPLTPPMASQPVSMSPQMASQATSTPAPQQASAPQPMANQPFAVSQPMVAPVAESADEAFARLQPVVNGEDREQAKRALQAHIATYPGHATAHNDLAALHYLTGNKEAALLHYRRAVELSPRDTTFRKNLADMLFVEEGQTDEAIGIYLELLKDDPRDVETLLNLGIISQVVGQPNEAETFYQRALEIEPWNQTVRERLTELRAEQENAPEAADDDDDEPAEDRYENVQHMVAEGKLDEATRELEKILVVYPNFAPAHNDLAVLCYERGDKEEALAHYERAAALVPANATFQKNLADFYFVEGRNVDGAIAIYLDQLQKEPKNVDTLMSLGKICTLLDRPQEAETFYGKVTQLEPWNQAARECLSNLKRCANA